MCVREQDVFPLCAILATALATASTPPLLCTHPGVWATTCNVRLSAPKGSAFLSRIMFFVCFRFFVVSIDWTAACLESRI